MRGKAAKCSSTCPALGITPAYAGKRTKSSRCPPRMWDHPRVCGEKNLCILRRVEIPGSPPRMRGKAAGPARQGRRLGITPAYAGKSIRSSARGRTRWDHPRVCGEKCMCGWYVSAFVGSPPRMRGKAPPDAVRILCGGITPAYAGKSWSWGSGTHRTGDHPRVCGEKYATVAAEVVQKGSPPRMRGKDSSFQLWRVSRRITPAYAGKSRRHDEKPERSEDHPRVCGEKLYSFNLYAYKIGSPPRMRGKVVLFQLVRL